MGTHKTTVTVRLILEQDEKLLFLQKTRKNGGGYSLVGGKVESTENAEEALIREGFEEIGVVVKRKHLRLVHLYYYREFDMIVILFSAKKWKGELESKEKEKFLKVVWFSKNEIPQDVSPITRHLVACYLRGSFFSEQ